MEQAALTGWVLQCAAPIDRETFECPPVGMWSGVACPLEDWGPPQDLGAVKVTPEAVEVALGIIRRSFENQKPAKQ